MGDFSDFQRGQIVGVLLAGVHITKMATLLGVSRAAFSKVVTTYTNHGKTSSAKRNSDWKLKQSERHRLTLKTIGSKNHKVLQQRWQQNLLFILKIVSTKTVWQKLHKSKIHGRAAIAKPLITENSPKRWKRQCDDHEIWPSDDWKYIIWSDVSPFMFPTLDHVYVWTSPKEAYNPACLVPTVKHGARSTMIWVAISSILLVLYLLWMVELLPVTTWTF